MLQQSQEQASLALASAAAQPGSLLQAADLPRSVPLPCVAHRARRLGRAQSPSVAEDAAPDPPRPPQNWVPA
jgi:hypothetical protein